MPNTLAHLGIQGLVTRSLLKDVDLKWVYLGAIIPDLPWIAQRVAKIVYPSINALNLRLYVMVQASLFFCLILSTALALVSKFPLETFIVLGSGSLLHLLLDSLQIKWANGVHLFAPFDWGLTNFGLAWPESLAVYFVTIFGLVYVLFYWKNSLFSPFPLYMPSAKQLSTGLIMTAIYLALPVALLSGPENKDNHFIKTLRSTDNRKGKAVEFDRVFYEHQGSGGKLHLFSGEKIKVSGLELEHSALVSIRGIFSDSDQVQVHEYHIHSIFRDAASYLGLSLIAILWLGSGFLSLRYVKKEKDEHRSRS